MAEVMPSDLWQSIVPLWTPMLRFVAKLLKVLVTTMAGVLLSVNKCLLRAFPPFPTLRHPWTGCG
jgi:hypothetical protein